MFVFLFDPFGHVFSVWGDISSFFSSFAIALVHE
jgi:hypothetical protein